MFSPVKAITAGALVFALGGLFLIAGPFDQQRTNAPGAEAPFAPPVEVTGLFIDKRGEYTVQGGDVETLPGEAGVFTVDGGTVLASDSRLEGTYTFINHEQTFVGNGLEASSRLTDACEAGADCMREFGGPFLDLRHSATSIKNEDGVWRSRPTVEPLFPGSVWSDIRVEVYDGEGGHAGLIAVLQFGAEATDDEFYGFIVDARQLRSAPENASTK